MAKHANQFFLLSILILATVVVVFGMRTFATARTARERLASEGAYRDLATRVAGSDAAMATSMANLEAGLDEIRTRLSAIEKVLKEVE